MSSPRVPDGNIALDLMNQADFISALTGAKAYDQIGVYQAAIDRGSTDLKLLIHPRMDVVISASDQTTPWITSLDLFLMGTPRDISQRIS